MELQWESASATVKESRLVDGLVKLLGIQKASLSETLLESLSEFLLVQHLVPHWESL
jgi:hypothetical protein